MAAVQAPANRAFPGRDMSRPKSGVVPPHSKSSDREPGSVPQPHALHHMRVPLDIPPPLLLTFFCTLFSPCNPDPRSKE